MEQKTHKLTLHLPPRIHRALLERSTELTLERNKRVPLNSLIIDALVAAGYGDGQGPDDHSDEEERRDDDKAEA